MCPSLHLMIFVCSFLLRLENVHLLLKFGLISFNFIISLCFPNRLTFVVAVLTDV